MEDLSTIPLTTRSTLKPYNTRGRPFLPTRVRSTTTPSTIITSSTSSSSRVPYLIPESSETVEEKTSPGRPGHRPGHRDDSLLENNADADHPRDNEISGSGVDNAHADVNSGIQEPSGPYRINRADLPSTTSHGRINIGAVVALGVFGSFVFLAAVLTTVVVLVRR